MPPVAKMYDVIVLGAGSGGMAFARKSAQLGKRALVIESGRIGGTCVNVGCVPKKLMYNAATLADHMREMAPEYGFTSKDSIGIDFKLSFQTLKKNRDTVVQRLNDIYMKNLVKEGVEFVHGHASFTADKHVQVGEQLFTAEHILIATGGRPVDMSRHIKEGGQYCIDSDMFFELEALPRKVLVIGAGYIAVELAGVLKSLGSDVTVIVRYDKPLRNFDETLSKTLTDEMQRTGIKLISNSTVNKIINTSAIQDADNKQQMRRQLTSEKSLKELNFSVEYVPTKDADAAPFKIDGFNCVLAAVGRDAIVDNIGLENTNIRLTAKNFIEVDKYQNSSVPGVYALGDVTGPVFLTPVAIAAARKLANRLFGGLKYQQEFLDYNDICTVVFSHPAPIGTVGLSEAQAREQFPSEQIKIYQSTFGNLFYTMVPPGNEKRVKSIFKMICVGQEERVVGIHLFGMGSDEILQGFGVALKMRATKANIDSCVAIHPTAAEELVTLK